MIFNSCIANNSSGDLQLPFGTLVKIDYTHDWTQDYKFTIYADDFSSIATLYDDSIFNTCLLTLFLRFRDSSNHATILIIKEVMYSGYNNDYKFVRFGSYYSDSTNYQLCIPYNPDTSPFDAGVVKVEISNKDIILSHGFYPDDSNTKVDMYCIVTYPTIE